MMDDQSNHFLSMGEPMVVPANVHESWSPEFDSEGIAIGPMTKECSVVIQDLIRRNLGTFPEAGSVLASAFRRLDSFDRTYEANGSCYLVARDQQRGGHCIGGAGVGPLQGLSPLEGLGEIRDLFVEPQYRGRGLGGRILKRCLFEARRLGYSRLYLETTPEMTYAQKLFLRHGFRPVTQSSQRPGAADHGVPCYYILENLNLGS
jgi:putative acetyltransferase